jgi:D-cysteine desulfhydrase family pyridoxal phosphate-dependent enzyme
MFTDKYPKAKLTHSPTALEQLLNVSKLFKGPNIWIKRDDCTGLGLGGNKVRQLEYYLGHALAQDSTTILTAGAIQSNHVRLCVAAAKKLGLEIEVVLAHQVGGRKSQYYQSGNPFLIELMGAKTHHYTEKKDEDSADSMLFSIAEKLRIEGKTPYVIPRSDNYLPYGSLGYVDFSAELLQQCNKLSMKIDGIVLASGSGATQAGILAGIKALGFSVPVYGFSVKRDEQAQTQRVLKKAQLVADMIGFRGIIDESDIWVSDNTLTPGYGQLNDALLNAIDLLAQHEGIFLDPTYTSRAMAGLIDLIQRKQFEPNQNIVFLHTGGSPALFGYPEILDDAFYD